MTLWNYPLKQMQHQNLLFGKKNQKTGKPLEEKVPRPTLFVRLHIVCKFKTSDTLYYGNKKVESNTRRFHEENKFFLV